MLNKLTWFRTNKLVWKRKKTVFVFLPVSITLIQTLTPFISSSNALSDTYSSATTWTVPAGVTSITVTAMGGSGGYGATDGAGSTARSPGPRGRVIATFAVNEGQVIGIYPGKKPVSNGTTGQNVGSGPGGLDTDPNGNYNGGAGGNAGPSGSSGGGGGGGAASTLYIAGSLALVAGGAGGGGGAANVLGSAFNGDAATSEITNQTNGGNGTSTSSTALNCERTDGGGGGGGGGGRWGSAGGGVYQTGSECAGYGGYRGNNFIVGTATSVTNTTDSSLTSDGSIVISYIGGQSIALSSLGTSSKSYPYSQVLSMSTSGSSGTGAITYAIASSGSTASGCTLSSSASNATLTASSSGTCLIVATIAADSDYSAATSSPATFTFSKAAQTLSFATTSYSKTFGETQTVVATSAGSGAITYSVGSSTACTVSGATVSITAGSGTCVVTATRASDDNYLEATSSNSVTFTVSKAAQATLILTSTSTQFLTNLRLTTSGGSETGTVSFAVSSAGTAGCSIANSDSLTSTSAGSCQVVATKLGTANYLPAYDTQTITVSKATLVLSTSAVATLKYGSTTTANYSVNRSVGAGGIPAISGSLTYETSTSTACNINSASGIVTMNRAAGTCSIRVRLSNDTNYQDTSSALIAITPAQADAITLTAADKTSIFNGAPTTITPTYSVSGLQFSDTVTVTYAYMGLLNNGDIYSYSSDKPTFAGLYSIIPLVTLTNSESYTAPAITTSGALTISRASRTISPSTYSTTNLKYGETATVTLNVTSPSTNNDGAFSYSVGSGCSIDSGSGTVTAANYQGTCSATTTIQQGNNYETATASAVSFSLSKADTITVTASSPSALNYTGSAAAVTPTVSVSGLVAGDSATGATFTYSRAPSCAAGGICQVGDIGPGGGKVFYVSGTVINAAPGISSGGLYLEMAPSSFSKTTYNWCEGPNNPNTTLFGASATTIGSGAANTKIMIDNCTGGAGVQAATLTLGGQSDWFLPSSGELAEIYNLRTMLGLGTGKYASTYLYWSSTEAENWIASSLVPWAGVGGQNKAQATPYLPIRAFSPTSTTYESPISTPTNAGSYRVTPSALTLAGGITTDYYLATIYQTGTFTINKVAQSAFTSHSTLSGVLGSALPILKFGGSGDGAESVETTNGSASGCALNGLFLSASAAGTCSVSATKESSENYLQSDSLFSVNFFYYVPEPVAPVSTTPTQIAIAAKNSWSVNATVGPTITSISPSSGPVGTVVTITGTGFDGVDVIKLGRRVLTSITGVSSTSITGVIPAGATTGPIMVSNSFGGDFSPTGFTVTPTPTP